MDLEGLAKKLLKNNRVEEEYGTWLHFLGRWIHRLARFTSILPNFSKKHTKKQPKIDPGMEKELFEKLKRYNSLISDHLDEHGFVLHETCDATLFSGLLSGVLAVDLEAARDRVGDWHRRPANKSCYPNGSASSFSRDMLLGVLWYFWLNRKRKLAEDTLARFKETDYVMGKGDPARLLVMPSGESTLAEIIHQLGGRSSWWARRMMQIWPKNLEGYQIHLAVIHCLLRGEVKGEIDSKMLEMLKIYAEKHPYNPLFQYAYHIYSDGDLTRAAQILLDPAKWPAHRLPKRKDRRSDWLTQRDWGADWLPAVKDPEKEHSGGDFIHVAWLVLRELENAESLKKSKGPSTSQKS